MYFWNIEKLTQDLKNGISEEENFKYFFIGTAFTTFIMSFPMENGKYDTIFNLIETLVGVILMFHTFKINKGNDGEKFLSRFVSISFVSSIRSLIFWLIGITIIGFIGGFIYGISGIESKEYFNIINSDFLSNFIILPLLFIYYFITVKYFKKLNHK